MTRHRPLVLTAWIVSVLAAGIASAGADNGLLFYLSGEKGTTADFAAPGTSQPNFDFEITRIPDGAKGAALQCGDLQRLCWWAPGNIYAQRGTLSFFWRSRYPVGPTEFPIFRVGYGDHSSWDMVWLRIDYNGHGFDAFVTDASLARTRVSVPVQPFPKPNEWTHLAISWDETRGIRFYVNGKLAAKNETVAVYNTALDQFGPHSRIISPYNVQSDYNFVRGGDIDEVRIYDRMLGDDNVATLAAGRAVTGLPPLPARDLGDARWRDEWWLRYGWNRPNDPPPYYAGPTLAVRKVEIHDAYDLKRWWWKACDGIRETTWPGVYNRSRLPGRHDYFTLPDWDCYVQSGKSVTFIMPDEPWNHLEISGAAWGKMELLKPDAANDGPAESLLFERPQGQEKTVHHLATPITGQKIRFTNVEQEEPIGELVAYSVTPGREPAGITNVACRLAAGAPTDASLTNLVRFTTGRYEPDERACLVARPAALRVRAARGRARTKGFLPLVHILVPDTWDKLDGGLDGIAIDLPALKVKPTHGELFPLNIQVKDPLWPMRNMFDFTFSVKPGEPKTLWLDLRDRILPPGKGIWISVAGAGPDFGPASLEGAAVRLVFKSRDAARPEHELDRFTQVRDCYAMLVEEHPHSSQFNLWNRFVGDLTDLLRVNPNHYPGRNYAALELGTPAPPFQQPEPPPGVPLWAFRQVELLGRVKHFVNWYIDNRQVPYGDFGGGISDDVDLLNTWPGVALMGCEPDKIKQSLHALLEAAFRNGMFTNGLPTIQTDELHSYEEGIDCLGANLILDYGNPKQIERAMVTARGVAGITGVNGAGHRHIRTSYFSGTKMAEEDPWGCVKAYSYLVLQPGQLLVDYNGNPAVKKVLLELADGLLAHRRQDANGHYVLPTAIRFRDDKDFTATRSYFPWPLFWTAWKWTGNRKYLDPIFDMGTTGIMAVNANALDILDLRKTWGPRILSGEQGAAVDARPNDGRGRARSHTYRVSRAPQFEWQLSGDKAYLEKLYADQIAWCDLLDYINTEGSLWIDRVGVPTAELQRARLGGVALLRNATFPGHVVSWRFEAPANDQSVAILVPDATPTGFKVIAYNLETMPVRATMTGWDVDPGLWEITQGIDTNDDDIADRDLTSRASDFERTTSLGFTFAPRAATVLTFKLQKPGLPYWERPDLGIDREDVQIQGRELRVRIHSLGAKPSRATTVVFHNRAGEIVSRTKLWALAAPVDLHPQTADVTLRLPEGEEAAGGVVEIDPDHQLEEVTRLNNAVRL
ncbi:MAG TPA: LamG-like jellyroll fold domain-containing protein [Verrucomicrobiae bacterium]|nr:LamG-like jellyroll fold domain-containing protein [Verrucomicrobiae bacterium]